MCNPAYIADNLLQLIVDCSMLIDSSTDKHELMNIEFHCRRLCFALNCERYRRLAVVPIRPVKAKKTWHILAAGYPMTGFSIFVIRQLQEKYLAANKRLYMAFVDLEMAFDRVPWKVIWWALRKLGCG